MEDDTSKTDEGLTALQAAFVHEALIDDDLAQAAVRAGFDPGNITEALKELLFEPAVTSALAVAKAQRKTRVKMTQDTVLHEMSLLSHSSIEHYFVDDEGNVELKVGAPEGAMRAIQSVKRTRTSRTDKKTGETTTIVDVLIKLWDKPTPLKLMGRQVGLFPDKVEHVGKDGGPIETVTRVIREIVRPQ